MPYHLKATRVLYQTSKYAPVSVVRLELVVLPETSAELKQAQIDAGLSLISASGTGGPLSLSTAGSPLEIYSAMVLGLQCYTGHPVDYSRVEKCETDHDYQVFIEYEDSATALYAGELATNLLNALLEYGGNLHAEVIARLQHELEAYVAFALRRRLNPNTRLLKEAARRLDIPFLSLDQPWGMPTWQGAAVPAGVVQFGWGRNQRRCLGSMPIGFFSQEELQQVTDRARLLPKLEDANIPLADQDLEFINRNQARRAQRSARRIGYPVMLRPRVAIPMQHKFPDDHVFGPVRNDEQVALVVNHLTKQAGVDVWLESCVAGRHYSFLVLNNKVLSVVCCTPPDVIGDGRHTIAELARYRAEAAKDAMTRRIWYGLAKSDQAQVCRLQLEGLSMDSVPASGEAVALRGIATCCNGGTGTNVTREMPSRFSSIALESAEVAGWQHLAGIDLIINDLSGPAAVPNCVLTAIDPSPDFLLHSRLSEEAPYYIEDSYLSLLFPAGRPSRIPTVAVTGTNGKTTTCRMVARILKVAGLKVGLSCSDGVYLGEELLLSGDESGVLGANEVLADARMEAAVLETARGNMANMGIAFDHCDVGVCLNVAEDHLGLEGIETLEDMAVHKRQLIERTTGTVVLNAEDRRCLAMQAHAQADEVILIAHSADHPAIKAHLHAGGRAVVIDTIRDVSSIVLVEPDMKIEPLIMVDKIPATVGGAAQHNVYNAQFAVAISLGLGIPKETIISGLMGFKMGVDTTPGRLNEIPGFPFKVLVDAAHNPHGFRSLVQYLNQQSVVGKKIIVFGANGSLPEHSIREISAIAAGNFGLYILRNYIDYDLRGRSRTEVPEMLRHELMCHGVSEHSIIVEPGAADSMDRALEYAEIDDLLVVQVRAGGDDKWRTINRLSESAAAYSD